MLNMIPLTGTRAQKGGLKEGDIHPALSGSWLCSLSKQSILEPPVWTVRRWTRGQRRICCSGSRGDRRAGAMATVVGSMQTGYRHTQE